MPTSRPSQVLRRILRHFPECFGFRGLHLGGDDREDSGGLAYVELALGIAELPPVVTVPADGVDLVQDSCDAFL